LRWFFGEQAAHVLGELPAIGAPLPMTFPSLADYDDPMASAMTPLIGAYWDRGGRTTRERLGLDPDAWRVVDPNLHRAIAGQALAFCAATNATTTRRLDDALAELRAGLHAGLVVEGEAIPALRDRVRAVFAGLTRDHAAMIARTEASRAVHAASLLSAEQSGVVAGKRWLASGNSCERCLEQERKTKEAALPLGGAFDQDPAADPAYATTTAPPLHPRCRCTIVLDLADEYRRLVDGEGGDAPPAIEPLNPAGPRVRRGP
jgi:hypothetical protein